jgi:ATP-binding cassette subfamily F protein 3
MLKFSSLSLRRGPRELLHDVSCTIHAGQKVGLTGANGVGKSSLFALLRGELSADGGDFSLPPATVIAYVAQEMPAVSATALDYVLDGDTELRNIEKQIAAAEQAGQGEAQARYLARLEAIDGYSAPSRAGRLLHGLGFTTAQEQVPVREFSGGWRMRLNLAQALMCRSDLLLLDEPTNHLDLDAVLWLEEWLDSYSGTLMLISHDRDFLDRVVTHIAHIEQGTLTLYSGNYSAFEGRRAERLAGQQAAYERQQREMARMQRFVERFKAKASKAKQAQSRVKALERMEVIAQAHVDSPFDFAFREPRQRANPLLQLDEVSVGYHQTPILSGVSLTLGEGDRIGLLGHNGAGKSTLIKLLAGEIDTLAGERRPAKALNIGYFAQHQLEQLDGDASPLLHLQRLDKQATEQALRNFLGGFAFHGDVTTSPVAPLSGGEKARLVLALIVYQRPNLLLLDEPTNHLDLEMRHALTTALQDFAGAMVVVSHDRHLLRTVADDLLLVDAGRVQAFDGDLDDYRRWLKEQERERGNNEATQDNNGSSKKQQRQQAAEQRRLLQPLQNKLRKLEQQLDRLHADKQTAQEQLLDNTLYEEANKAKLTQVLHRQREIESQLQVVEAEWLQVSEDLEGLS